MLSVIIVSYNTKELLRQCLELLFASQGVGEMEVFVVDNASHDGSAQLVRQTFPQVTVMENQENLGFAAANNQAWKKAAGDYVLLLNPDAFVSSEAISRTLAFLEANPSCGICGGRLEKPDGSLDPSARRFPSWISKLLTLTGLRARYPSSPIFSHFEFGSFAHDTIMEVDWVPGTFTMYRKALFDKSGIFDERFFIYYEETDVCLALKRSGGKVFFLPEATVVHVGGASSKTRKDQRFDTGGNQLIQYRMRSEWLYFRKNHGLVAVLANAGVEYLWHGMRFVANLLPGRSEGELKRNHARALIRELNTSLAATRFGAVSPAIPW